ncbi:MAG: porin, partial [Mesorhizobium sp.]
AVMAPEPEPVEYVRVCDAYGAGFFYIPGTETCLKISGYVWYQIGASSFDPTLASNNIVPSSATGILGDGWGKSVRARLNVDARSETEWGTLRSYIRMQADWNGVGDGPVAIDQAYIELAGFKMGYSESFWVDSGNGGPSNYGSHSWSGMNYGYQQRALIGYRFESNGFFGALSLEDDALSSFGSSRNAAGAVVIPGYNGADYVPDVVAKIGFGGGWGAVWAKVGFDSDRTNTYTIGTGQEGDSGWGAQIGAQFNMPNMPGSSLRLIGYYADSDNRFGTGSPFGTLLNYAPVAAGTVTALAAGTNGTAEWSILASYNQQFSETFGASVAVQYFNDFYFPGTDVGTGIDGWSAELSTVWFPVKDFEVRTELHYDTIDAPGVDGTVSGFLRFTRYF